MILRLRTANGPRKNSKGLRIISSPPTQACYVCYAWHVFFFRNVCNVHGAYLGISPATPRVMVWAPGGVILGAANRLFRTVGPVGVKPFGGREIELPLAKQDVKSGVFS